MTEIEQLRAELAVLRQYREKVKKLAFGLIAIESSHLEWQAKNQNPVSPASANEPAKPHLTIKELMAKTIQEQREERFGKSR
jgi:hypothetical protein